MQARKHAVRRTDRPHRLLQWRISRRTGLRSGTLGLVLVVVATAACGGGDDDDDDEEEEEDDD